MTPIICRALTPNDYGAVRRLFTHFQGDPAMAHFRPHPFTPREARRVTHPTPDYYAGCWTGSQLVGYGMLRGWAEGYDAPTLGIGLDRAVRGQGLARCLMQHLHAIAKARHAPCILLKVDRDNPPAIRLYETLGYAMTEPRGAEYLKGTLRVGRAR